MSLLGHDQDSVAAPRSATDVATELIRKAILDGRLAPGDRLKENELALDLGISRTPIREALLLLQSEGLITADPRRGSSVRTFSAAELLDMYNIRAVLEGYAARQAAASITKEQLAALRESCDRFKGLSGSGDKTALSDENITFHGIIVEATGSARLAQLIRSSVELPRTYRALWYVEEADLLRSDRGHRRIVKALAAGDGEAADQMMQTHIREGVAFLIKRLT